MPKTTPDPARRRLLARTRDTAAAAAALAALPPLPVAVEAAPVAQAAAEAEPGRGYRESDHTRRYYQLARF